MTYYTYIAADIPLKPEQYHDAIFELAHCEERIKGFELPIQLEIYNGVTKKRALRSLLSFIEQQAQAHKRCAFQIAMLINSNREPFLVTEKKYVQLHKINSEQDLLLEEGQLLTIEKIQLVY